MEPKTCEQSVKRGKTRSNRPVKGSKGRLVIFLYKPDSLEALRPLRIGNLAHSLGMPSKGGKTSKQPLNKKAKKVQAKNTFDSNKPFKGAGLGRNR